jgi:hypothetical protein
MGVPGVLVLRAICQFSDCCKVIRYGTMAQDVSISIVMAGSLWLAK